MGVLDSKKCLISSFLLFWTKNILLAGAMTIPIQSTLRHLRPKPLKQTMITSSLSRLLS